MKSTSIDTKTALFVNLTYKYYIFILKKQIILVSN